MKKFHFRLQRVLDAKEGEEKMKQRELGRVQQILLGEEKKIDDLNRQMVDQEKRQRKLISGKSKVSDLMMNNRWQLELKKRIRLQEEVVAKCQEEVEEKQTDYNICNNAANGGLCGGLDITYGDGYENLCCEEHGLCC